MNFMSDHKRTLTRSRNFMRDGLDREGARHCRFVNRSFGIRSLRGKSTEIRLTVLDQVIRMPSIQRIAKGKKVRVRLCHPFEAVNPPSENKRSV
jgi:hypothetical protein